MKNKDKIVSIVAAELGLPVKRVRPVIMSQLDLVKQSIKNKEKKSIYLRKVGTFMSPEVRSDLWEKKLETNKANKIKNKLLNNNKSEDTEEDSLFFE